MFSGLVPSIMSYFLNCKFFLSGPAENVVFAPYVPKGKQRQQ